MIVMPSNNTGFEAGRLFGRFPDRLAHLHSVDSPREPKQGVIWALDNGVFGAWQKGIEWSEEPLFQYLDLYSMWKPCWVVAPDWVADRKLTIERWSKYLPALRSYGVPLAFVVQDGMSPEDVPSEADVVFVGGSTSWKWKNLKTWTENFPRVHVGRVNTYRLLWMAHEVGAESCDGTGWFRGDAKQLSGLTRYLEESGDRKKPQLEFSWV